MLRSIGPGAADKTRPAEFDLLCAPQNPRISIRAATVADLAEIYGIIRRNVSFAVAPPDVMHFAMAINRNNIIAFSRHGEVVGVYAMLMLSIGGLEALLVGDFNGRDPHVSHLATRLEHPAAIYQWLVVAPGLAAEGVMHVAASLQQPYYRNANLYMRSFSHAGVRISTALGFHAVDGAALKGLYRYVRLINRRGASEAQPAVLPRAA